MGKPSMSITSPAGMSRPTLFSASSGSQESNVLDAFGTIPQERAKSKVLWQLWLLVPLLAFAAWGVAVKLKAGPATPSTLGTKDAAVTLPSPVPEVLPQPHRIELATETPALSPEGTSETSSPVAEPSAAESTSPFSHFESITATPTVSIGSTSPAPTRPSKVAAMAITPAPTAHIAEAPSKKLSARDADVELLSALMKHIERGGTSSVIPEAKSQTQAASPPKSISYRVNECQSSDLSESLACVRRICQGSWGKTNVCPQSLAPRSTATKAASNAASKTKSKPGDKTKSAKKSTNKATAKSTPAD